MHLSYTHEEGMGYGRYGTKMFHALRDLGVDVVDGLAPDEQCPAAVAAWTAIPTHARGWFKGQWTVLATMWEATVVPESFADCLHNFDMLVVPCAANAESFSVHHDNIAKVPLGVDPDEWHFVEREDPEDTFVFLTAGSGRRKGVDVALDAFRKAFTGKENPTPKLVVKSRGLNEMLPRDVEVVSAKLTAEGERALYAMAHCYIGASRGEGWGLMPLQAIAQGCPTILTDAHGHAEFAHLGWGIPAKLSKADVYLYGDGGDWWEPDLDALVDQMRWVYEHYDHAREQAHYNSTQANTCFTWHEAARKFIESVGAPRLDDHLLTPGEWTIPDTKKYPVRVVRQWQAEVAGFDHLWVPGVTYWEPSDVKRILGDVGVLDPDCAGEGGMTEAQVAAARLPSGRNARCPTCNQMFNSGVKWEPDE